MTGKLEDKVAIITGAASGIGRATALLFASEGAKLIAADWDGEKGQRVAEEIFERGEDAIFIKTDVSEPEDMQQVVEKAVETYGHLDIIFNMPASRGSRLRRRTAAWRTGTASSASTLRASSSG